MKKAQSDMNQEETVLRIAMEYIEMPDLKLTVEQARRLWNLPANVCDTALATLVSRGFLRRTPAGAFLRTASGLRTPLSQAS